MTGEPNKLEAMADHELAVAERYRWWAVYLVREKRRLQGIADAVQAEAAAEATGLRLTGGLPPIEPDIPEGMETPEDMLTRLDAELALDAAAAELEDKDMDEDHREDHDDHNDEVTTTGEPGSNPDAEASEAAPAEDDETLRRRLSGRAALLGGSFDNEEEG